MTTGADWLASARKLLDALRPGPEPTPAGPAAPAGSHAADCRWCPVCQAAAVVRGERPEVTGALADVLITTASVLRDLAGEPTRPGADVVDADEPRDEEGPDPRPVQRIDIA